MLNTLIQEGGWRWSDFDDVTDEELTDIINAKANLKEAKKKKENEPVGGDLDTSMAKFLKQNGLI